MDWPCCLRATCVRGRLRLRVGVRVRIGVRVMVRVGLRVESHHY